MKTLYLDCGMGAAGDMLTAALLDLYDDKEGFLREINAALAGMAVVSAEPCVECGVTGLHVHVSIDGEEEGGGHSHEHHHHHTGIREIRTLIDGTLLSDTVRKNARAVFDSIAAAEAAVHGQEMEQIHFHEVGSIDAVADVLGVCLLMEKLDPDEVICSAVNVGGGTVKCAHGELPVPAPATERLLRGVPWYEGEIMSELCTPTGAALVTYFADRFEKTPVLTVKGCGYGMGRKRFERLNALRALLGEREEKPERLLELQCNLDDMTGEELGFAQEKLLEDGALDVWTTPVGMKKSRPGVMLSVLCRAEQREDLLRSIFRHTTTLGVRQFSCQRHALSRSFYRADTPWGEITVKRAEGFGIKREKPEYEEVAGIARENSLSLREVREKIETGNPSKLPGVSI